MSKIRIAEIENIFKDIFDEEKGKVASVETIFEKADDDEFYKLVISIHSLSVEDTLIIHTKFIFKSDLEKHFIIDDSFMYLYDINCVYHKVEYTNIIDIKSKIEKIINSNNFGEDIQILSDFIEAPAMFLNYYLKRSRITDYSVFDVKYDPKFKTTPCDKVTFDFEVNVNNNYTISVSVSKRDREEDEDHDTYKFQFKFLDKIETVEADSLKNIHFMIGSNIARILDEKLK
jgi:hypothetical protein